MFNAPSKSCKRKYEIRREELEAILFIYLRELCIYCFVIIKLINQFLFNINYRYCNLVFQNSHKLLAKYSIGNIE